MRRRNGCKQTDIYNFKVKVREFLLDLINGIKSMMSVLFIVPLIISTPIAAQDNDGLQLLPFNDRLQLLPFVQIGEDGINDGLQLLPFVPIDDGLELLPFTGEIIRFPGEDGSIGESDGNIDPSNTASVNSWGSGFNVSYEYEVTESDTGGGLLNEWRLDIRFSGSSTIVDAWIPGGYNGGLDEFSAPGLYYITNENFDFIDQFSAGETITFFIQGQGSDFDPSSLSINFESLTQIDSTASATAGGELACESPTPISLPFSFDGQGEYCWEVTGDVDFINSWNVNSVTVNGEEHIGYRFVSQLPPVVDGSYIIQYSSSVPYGHFEISGTN